MQLVCSPLLTLKERMKIFIYLPFVYSHGFLAQSSCVLTTGMCRRLAPLPVDEDLCADVPDIWPSTHRLAVGTHELSRGEVGSPRASEALFVARS
jgi:hypothetical protein